MIAHNFFQIPDLSLIDYPREYLFPAKKPYQEKVSGEPMERLMKFFDLEIEAFLPIYAL
jgi:hypothetical protein